ncbi:peptide chain release factor 2 [Peloplasma aerotolerans]|uniref:Peptide chain release factor 2 n=1 Tax=Peloplasma aerotolerans TaxID=3044389 RepID=A0AAW6U605_9MOLU|nr:peptide chain release factor 2 [Mariniplasma sp. M4Ah]MDI6453413.1 peptide chain release factor 2 [Mariniplasma sp. M4Ah]MDR4968042.1 peptide chain release factor 2 [Acholeplasmataceae bacterium]
METYDVNKFISNMNESIEDLKKALNPQKLESQYRELNDLMQQPNFWSDTNQAKKITKQATEIRQKLDEFSDLEKQHKNLVDWFEISEEGTEEWDVLETDLETLQKKLKAFEIKTLLNEPYDANNTIIELHPGAGGTESQDWCDMLYRMYTRYAQKKNFKVELLDYQAGEEAGIKSVTLLIKGAYAYGYLKAERGVHRLVRISPFDSNARRHTSFASVDVLPEIIDEVDVEIKDEDLKIDVYRSGGAGGQSVNTTDSAVRITHLPTNIVVTCQNERSQLKNKEAAMSVLKSKLAQEEIKKQEAILKDIKGEQKDIAWGSQIRSYVFHPYQMVKDHRTNYEVGNVDLVMDGELDGFINAYLKAGDTDE